MTQPPTSTAPAEPSVIPRVRPSREPTWTVTPRPRISETEALQAAERLREELSRVPFYAKKAAKAAAQGDEMAYWLALQGSQATAHRRSDPPASTR